MPAPTLVKKHADTTSPRILFALLVVLCAVAAHATFCVFFPKNLPFAPFALATFIAARRAGVIGGLTATTASAFALRCWFLPPGAAFLDEARLGLGLFVAAGLFISWQSRTPQKQFATPDAAVTPDLIPFEYAGPTQPVA